MPVSYISTPIASSPYVKPLDLNILSTVLSYKQQKYDTEADKVQNQINSIAAQTQGMNEVDRKYFNDKLNSNVAQINSLGGVDLSDSNVGNQIEGFASSIYNDNKIINSVTAAKSIQALTSSYQKVKSDPKLNKLYSAANEDWDMNAVNSYYKNTEPGQGYKGNTSFTPFAEYDKGVNAALDKVKATEWDYIQNATGTGGYYAIKGTHKEVTPEDVRRVVESSLNGDQLAQLKRDGYYGLVKVKGYQKSDLAIRAVALTDKEVMGIDQDIKSLTSQMLLNKGDNTSLQKQIKDLSKKRDDLLVTKSSNYSQYDDVSLANSVFYNNYVNGKISRNAFTEDKKTSTIDPVSKFITEQKNHNEQFRNALELRQKIHEDNLKLGYDRLRTQYPNGSISSNVNPNSDPYNGSADGVVVIEPSKDLATEQKKYVQVKQNISDIEKEMHEKVKALIQNAALKNGVSLESILKDYNKDSKIDIEDLFYNDLLPNDKQEEFLKKGLPNSAFNMLDQKNEKHKIIYDLFNNINQTINAHINTKDVTLDGKYSNEVLSTIEEIAQLQLKKENYTKLLNIEGIQRTPLGNLTFERDHFWQDAEYEGTPNKPVYAKGQGIRMPFVNFRDRVFTENDYKNSDYQSLLTAVIAENKLTETSKKNNLRIMTIGKQPQQDGNFKIKATVAWEDSKGVSHTNPNIEVSQNAVQKFIPSDNKFSTLDYIVTENNIPELPIYSTKTDLTGKTNNFIVKMRTVPNLIIGDKGNKSYSYIPQIFDNENQKWVNAYNQAVPYASQAALIANNIIKQAPNKKALLEKLKLLNQ